jgi:hypothetical protein
LQRFRSEIRHFALRSKCMECFSENKH